jgi:hypothetical protein
MKTSEWSYIDNKTPYSELLEKFYDIMWMDSIEWRKRSKAISNMSNEIGKIKFVAKKRKPLTSDRILEIYEKVAEDLHNINCNWLTNEECTERRYRMKIELKFLACHINTH